MKGRESGSDRNTPALEGEGSVSSWEIVTMTPSKSQRSPEFALVIFLGQGKTSLHFLIFRLLHIFITLSNLTAKKKKRGNDAYH